MKVQGYTSSDSAEGPIRSGLWIFGFCLELWPRERLDI